MAFLELKNIGKIYASEGAVAVGIRGVDLSFERGEFVAVTGESGSGKSTLLNVISGMDTYEEGELFIEGQPTSHYLQPDWEEYRKKYISFVFQDYNIIESFTVLQNVELSLMHIKSAAARRKRALELLDRVGMSGHIGQKGSKLSGGQKQRTVIARALAKDSPVILADEPTGNLDAGTAAEIMALLSEVSKDKLVIVVTHSFDETEKYATRHIRVYDGAIAADTRLRAHETSEGAIPDEPKQSLSGILSNGFSLGWAIFRSKPALSLFMCFLLLVGTVAMTGISSSSAAAAELFEKKYVFTPVEGRLVIAKRDKSSFSAGEVKELAEKAGADGIFRFDAAFDRSVEVTSRNANLSGCRVVLPDRKTTPSAGRLPEKYNEILLRIPVSEARGEFSVKGFEPFTVQIFGNDFQVVGLKTFRDNRKDPEIIATREGFDYISARLCSENYLKIDGTVSVSGEPAGSFGRIMPSETLSGNEAYFDVSGASKPVYGAALGAEAECAVGSQTVTLSFDGKYAGGGESPNTLYVSPEKYTGMITEVVENETSGYPQLSLVLGSDREARKAAESLTDGKYIAVSSDTDREMNLFELLEAFLSGTFSVIMWVLGIVFLAFFINLCTSKTLEAFRGEMAVMRSMGIPVRVIQTGMFFRMLISAVPAIVISVTAVLVIFSVPALSSVFSYIPPAVFILVLLGMLLIVIRVTSKQVKKLFGTSVKKAIRGGK